jgi:hypothetical protein
LRSKSNKRISAEIEGATETLSLAMSKNVNQQALVGGTKTTGDVRVRPNDPVVEIARS